MIPQPHGFDLLEFEIITNPGEDFRSLTQTVSGGEASRIMLGIKSVLADADSIPTLIFDEADAGVSGRIARIVGEQIEELSRYHQVICITHLPQIASLGGIMWSWKKRFCRDGQKPGFANFRMRTGFRKSPNFLEQVK